MASAYNPEDETNECVQNVDEGPSKSNGRCIRPLPFIATFSLLALSWIILSGKFDAFHLTLGLISCLIVSWTSSDLLFPTSRASQIDVRWFRFVLYIPWLLLEVFKANTWVLYLCFHPRMMDYVDPKVITFKSNIKNRMALVTFANSITLTPGTITVDADVDGNFVVHALDAKSAAGLPGEMEKRVARVFGEEI